MKNSKKDSKILKEMKKQYKDMIWDAKKRDPKRIDRILKLIKKIWQDNSDLRLGQIIDTSCSYENTFYIEDHELEYRLKKEYKIK